MLEASLSDFANIVIIADPKKRPYFPILVREALARIGSKPLGRKLLGELSAGPKMLRSAPPKVEYAVAILPPREEIRSTPRGPADFSPGNVTVRVKENAATFHNNDRNDPLDRPGSASAIFWNPNVIATPDGSRPSFIGLAHELIHAWRNGRGFAHSETDEEERQTVGLSFEADDINENSIRSEHGLPPRPRYAGLRHECDWLAPLIT